MLNDTILQQAQYRHANHYLKRLKDANALFSQGARQQAFHKFETDWLQIQRAHSWAVENRSRQADAVTLCNAYPLEGGQLLGTRQMIPDRIQWLKIAIDAAHSLQEKQAELSHHLELGRAYLLISDSENGLAHGNKALDLAVMLGNREAEVRALTVISNHLQHAGKLLEARDYSHRSLKISESTGDKQGIATNSGNLGTIETTLGNYDEAEKYQRLSLQINREINNLIGVSKALNNLGSLNWQQGKLDEAQNFYEEALRLREELNDHAGIADVFNNLGAVAALKENFSLAKQRWQACLEISRKHNLRRLITTSLVNLAYVSRDLKDYDASLRYFEEALPLAEEIKLRYVVANARIGFGFLQLTLGNAKAAHDLFIDAIQLSQTMGVLPLVVWGLVGIARMEVEAGDPLYAARIAGMIKVHKLSGDSNLRGDLDELLIRLEATVPADDLSAALELGGTLTIESVLEQVLA